MKAVLTAEKRPALTRVRPHTLLAMNLMTHEDQEDVQIPVQSTHHVRIVLVREFVISSPEVVATIGAT